MIYDYIRQYLLKDTKRITNKYVIYIYLSLKCIHTHIFCLQIKKSRYFSRVATVILYSDISVMVDIYVHGYITTVRMY